MGFPNRYKSVCYRCGGVVEAGEGVCQKQDGEWAVRHAGRKCPENAQKPEPRNEEPARRDDVLVTGNTYPVRDELKALGGKWDGRSKGWLVPRDKAAEAKALVDAQPAKVRRRRGGSPFGSGRYECDECGDYVTPGTRCWETGATH